MTGSQRKEYRRIGLSNKEIDEIHGLCERHDLGFREEMVVFEKARNFGSSSVIVTLRAMFREPKKTFESPLERFQRFFEPRRKAIKATERSRRDARSQEKIRDEVHRQYDSGFRPDPMELWKQLKYELESGLITEKEYDTGVQGLASVCDFEPPDESEAGDKAL